MTISTDIDLNAIPHPRDCHPVPVGVPLPKGVPVWAVYEDGHCEWHPDGYAHSDAMLLTAEPLVAPPTPDDSPIILSIRTLSGEYLAKEALAVWEPLQDAWRFVRGDGKSHWVDSEDIVEWSPAVVTKVGHGLWDERDKRRRTDEEGDTWEWSRQRRIWENTEHPRVVGALSVLQEHCGNDYLIGFADED